MKTSPTERRAEIAHLLKTRAKPITGGELSKKFEVSRQIIVGDINALKSEGYEIVSTHEGYTVDRAPHKERVFKLYHTSAETEDELSLIIERGGVVVNVFVWHKVYGRIEAPLNISTVDGVKQFIEGVRSGKSTELMTVTGGYHYHTVHAESEDVLDKIEAALNEKGYIAPEL